MEYREAESKHSHLTMYGLALGNAEWMPPTRNAQCADGRPQTHSRITRGRESDSSVAVSEVGYG